MKVYLWNNFHQFQRFVFTTRIPESVSNSYSFLLPKAASRGVLLKKVFLEISQNSQENTCFIVSFLIKLQAWDLRTTCFCFSESDYSFPGQFPFTDSFEIEGEIIWSFTFFSPIITVFRSTAYKFRLWHFYDETCFIFKIWFDLFEFTWSEIS